MNTPSPFQVAREASNNLSSSFRRVNDENAIEGILSQAMGTGDPQVVQDSIGKILSQVSPERQGVALQYLQNTFSNLQEKQKLAKTESREREAALGAGYTYGVPPQVAAQQVKDRAKGTRLAQYGLGQDQGSNQQIQPTLSGNAEQGNAPQSQQADSSQSLQSGFKNLPDDQLVIASGASDKEISEPAKAELKRRQEDRKIEQKEKTASRDEEIAFHKESQAYDDELFKQSKIAKKQFGAIEDVEKAISSGNISPGSLANIFKGFGKIGDKISEALVNKDQAALMASIPQLLEGWKEVFGVRLSDADLKLLQDKLPSIGKTPEANRAIVKVLRKYADMTVLRSQIAREVKEKNKGLRPLGYADKIEQLFDERIAPVKIVNPNNGNIIEVPAYKVSEAINAGGRLSNE